MDSVLKTVQRYLYIGNDVPFFLHSPHTPLDVELGKRVLTPAVHLPEQGSATGTETPPETAQSKKKLKKAKAKAAKAAEKHAAAQAAQKEMSHEPGKETVSIIAKNATDKSGPDTEGKAESKQDVTAAQPVQKVQLPSPLLALIKSAIKGKVLRRTDECLFALAYYAREFPTPEERHAAYDMVVEVVGGSRDLFFFLSYYMQLATQSGHAGFGHGIRAALTRWYDKHTAMQLADMLAKSRSYEGWTHKDVIAKAHLKLTCPEKQSLIDAVMKRTSQLIAGKPTEKKKGKKGKKNKAVAGARAGDTAPKVSEAVRRYQTMRQFRSAPTVTKVLDNIKQHGMTLDMVPLHFKRSLKVWEALYPTITYRELLNAALPMADFRLLRQGLDEPNIMTYAAALENRLSALEEEQIHPIDVHQIAKLFETRRRYESKTKEIVHKFNIPSVGVPIASEVLQKLQAAVDHSFSHHPKTGVRYYIALDLRKPHEKKTVFRSEIMSCFHASVMLAFSIFKREQNVTVVAFTEQEDILKPVQFTASMNWQQAVAHCQGLLLPKTKVSLAAPIARAEADKLKVDLFITITDSLIRVNPTRTPPYVALRDYRKKVKLNLSRYVAVSLSHHEPSFDFSSCSDTTGILEMVGYNGTNAKIIEAFAKSLFI
uniref:TROVE domain-containing protein n=1 Tax=Anopheles atroparvus TaxID=41427 RepID=A0AAG5D3U9_ANOAO